MDDVRKDQEYIRLLELQSLGTEDWGKVIENINNFLYKGWNVKDAEAALHEIEKMKSPLHELEAVLFIKIQMLNKVAQET